LIIEDPAEVGNKVEILSPSEQLRQCTVTDRDSTKFKIHYDGYDAKYDEWVEINSPRVNLTTYQGHKYVSCAPDVGGQDQEPDGPLNTSVCLHCNKPKGHHSGKGAILSVNLLKNSTGVDQAKDLVIILTEHPTLKSLCGNKGNETELDMSGKMDGAEDAIMLAAEVVDNRALTSLNLSSNGLTRGTLKAEHRNDYEKTHGAKWGSKDYHFESDLQGIIALVTAIPDMGALIKLDISKNFIGAEQKGSLQRMCVASGIDLAMRHVLLPSEHPLGGGCRRHFRTGAALPTRAARSAMA
jgi:hypothetical protein